MTQEEKELVEIFDSLGCEVWGGTPLDLAKAIIQHYPQILAEKVWEGYSNTIVTNALEIVWEHPKSFIDKKHIELFIREVVE